MKDQNLATAIVGTMQMAESILHEEVKVIDSQPYLKEVWFRYLISNLRILLKEHGYPVQGEQISPYQIGDLVKFQYGVTEQVGFITENRGRLAQGDRWLYTVDFIHDTKLNRVELPEDELTKVSK